MKKRIVFLFLFVVALQVYAQETTTSDDGTTTITFEGEGKKVNYKEGYRNAFAVAPITARSGDFPLFYERKVHKHISLSLGVGFTTKNYLKSAQDTYSELPEHGEFVHDAARIEKTGYSINPCVRIYPQSAGALDDGIVLTIDYRFREYNNDLISEEFGALEDFYTTNEFRFLIGYLRYYKGTRLFYEIYAGVGHRNTALHIYEFDDTKVDFMQENYKDGLMLNDEIQKRFFLSAGLKIGLAF